MRTLRTTKTSFILLGGGLALMTVLSGCAMSGGGYSVLHREAGAADALPPAVAADRDEIAVDTARLVGEHDGASLWLARAERPNTVCLIVYPNEKEWISGCGAEGRQIGVGGPPGEFVLRPDGAPALEGSTQLSDNVYVLTE